MKKKGLAISLVFALSVPLCICAAAYATCGYHFKGTWFGEYYYVDDRSDGYGELADAAIEAWNDAVEFEGDGTLDIDLIETTDGDSMKTRIEVSPLDRGADGIAGFTYYLDVDSSGVWSYINFGGYPNKNYQAASTVINRTYTDNYTDAKTQNVIMHEIGHAFGLSHSSTTSDDGALMYKSITSVSRLRTPQEDDVNGVRDIYE